MAERRESNAGDRGPTVREVGEQVRDDLNLLRETAERRQGEILDEARRFVDEHPFLSVGAAFGFGYVVSGALVSATTARLARYGARLYFSRVVRARVGGDLVSLIWRVASATAAPSASAATSEPVGPPASRH